MTRARTDRCLRLPSGAAAVHLRIDADVVVLDARALEPGASLGIEDGDALTTIQLPETHAIDVALVRALEAPPLYLTGRIGLLSGRVGRWTLPTVHMPESRRVGWGGYVGPAHAALPEAAVRVCTGPGALLAAADGRRAQVRVALGDSQGTRFAPEVPSEPALFLHIEDCAALTEVGVNAHAWETRIVGCPSLRRADGTGILATLERCGDTDRLDAVGAWKHLVPRDCPAATLRALAPSIYPRGTPGQIVSLHGAALLGNGPPTLGASRKVTPVRIAEVAADPAWAADTLDEALDDDPTRAARARRLLARPGFDTAAVLERLGQRVEGGAPVARLWEVRQSLAGRAYGGWAWHWSFPLNVAHRPAWLADLALLEHASQDDVPEVADEARAILASLHGTRQPQEVWLLAEGRAARAARGASTCWIDDLLGRALDLPEPGDAAPRDAHRWVLPWELEAHLPAILRLLGEESHPATGDGWRHALYRWLHRCGSGEVGLDVLHAAARGGDPAARRFLAEAALDGGRWSAEERAEAMRRVLGLGA